MKLSCIVLRTVPEGKPRRCTRARPLSNGAEHYGGHPLCPCAWHHRKFLSPYLALEYALCFHCNSKTKGWFVHLTSTAVLHDDPTEHSGRRDDRVDVALFGRCYHWWSEQVLAARESRIAEKRDDD